MVGVGGIGSVDFGLPGEEFLLAAERMEAEMVGARAAVGEAAVSISGTGRVCAQGVEDRSSAAESAIILPEPIGDPLEPMNRGLWKLNQFVLRTAIQPSAKIYRVIVPSDVRRGIRNVGRNILYPRNLANNLLQK